MLTPPNMKTNYTRSCRPSAALLLVVLAGGLAGCEMDSYMDPGEVIRAENTATIVPVLDRIAQVEGGDSANPNQFSPVTAEDLQVEAESYRIAPGDGLIVRIQDFFVDGLTADFERLVDDRGFVDLPKLGPVFISGQTADEAGLTIVRALRTRRVLTDAVVDVNAVQRRKQTFTIIGGVTNPGTYTIPKPDFRLLEAVGNGGRFSENVQWVYVIRSLPLSAPVTRGVSMPVDDTSAPVAPVTPANPAGEPVKKDSVIDLIDSLSKPEEPKPPSPGMLGQPEPLPTAQPVPVIDIDAATKPGDATTGGSDWQFVNGQWVKGPGGKSSTADPSSGILTQRVLQIPMAALMNGAPQYNIVVRPGDTVRVQSLNEGIVYVHGNVNRPGVYTLPQTSRMTLIRAIAAASDLNDQGIPERVDITRYIGPDRQATVRVNYRAIVEGTQPDIVMRDGDVVNVGTNFWAFPLSVIRQGFRANYGFGFTLDRNFGFDVFGPQRTNSTNF